MTEMMQRETPLTVGQVADAFGVTVRTLHHYDGIGLLCPSARSGAGYRLYTEADVTRLRNIVVYRRLGFSLEEIAVLLDDPDADVVEHLRRQRATVMSRLDEMNDLVHAIDHALAKEVTGMQLTKDEQRELFGETFSDEYAAEAQGRWGDTDAWKQSQERVATYTKDDWRRIKAEGDAINDAFVTALDAGLPPTSDDAVDAAERARAHIDTWFYDITREFHCKLADLYVNDERFEKTYEQQREGLARYVHDAIYANAERNRVE